MSNYQTDTSEKDDLVNEISAYEGGIQDETETMSLPAMRLRPALRARRFQRGRCNHE